MHGHCYGRCGACVSKLQILHQVSFSPGNPNVGSKGESYLKGFNQHHVNQIVAYTPTDFTYEDAVCYFCSHNYTAFLTHTNCMNCQILQFMKPAMHPVQELNCCL
jgi:hypothetical protein